MYSLKNYPIEISEYDKDIINKIKNLNFNNIIYKKLKELSKEYNIKIIYKSESTTAAIVSDIWLIVFKATSKIWIEVFDYLIIKEKNINIYDLEEYKDKKVSYFDIPILNDRVVCNIEEELIYSMVEFVVGLYIQLKFELDDALYMSKKDLEKIKKEIFRILNKMKENNIIKKWSYEEDINEIIVSGEKNKITLNLRPFGLYVENQLTGTRSLYKNKTIFYETIIQAVYIAIELLL